jgi:hypothetical protein
MLMKSVPGLIAEIGCAFNHDLEADQAFVDHRARTRM